MEHARLDRVQHLGYEPEEPEVRGAITLGPVPLMSPSLFSAASALLADWD